MRSPLRIAAIVVTACLATAGRLPADAAERQPTHAAAAEAVFLLTHGRLPNPAELTRLTGDGGESGVRVWLERTKAGLAADPAAARAAAVIAVQDAFGRAAGESDFTGPSVAPATYVEHVQRHLAWLKENPTTYDAIIDRAYRFVVRRSAYPEELAYWRKYDTLSYALLVGCIEDWARRNQPGLMVTAGTPTVPINSEFLITVRLSPAEAGMLGAALGLSPEPDPYLNRAADARNVVAPGARQIVASGGIHFAAAGGPKLAAFGQPAEAPRD